MADIQVKVDWSNLTDQLEKLEVALRTAKNPESYKTDLDEIAKFMLDTSKGFISKNNAIWSGDMYNKMRVEVFSGGIKLWNDAINSRTGYPYPRAIEYGFMSKGGYRPARPFLRPTLRLASELSKNRLENTLLNVLEGRSLGDNRGRKATLPFGGNLGQNASQKSAGMNQMQSSWSGGKGSAWDGKK